MRITSEMMVANSVRRLSTRLGRYEQSQAELASGKRIRRPSQDPAGAGRAMTLKAQLRSKEQEQRNISDAVSWLDTTDSSLQTAIDRLHRARELAVRGGNTLSAGEYEALAKEVDQIRADLVGIANTRHRGVPLFGGFSANDPVSGPPWNITSAGNVRRRISETEQVDVNTLATDAFGAAGASVFDTLEQLATELRAGAPANVSALIGNIDADRERLGAALATVGATRNRVEAAEIRSTESALSIRGELAQVEDVDIAEAIMELQLQEVAYQATLGALGRALPQSLVSFLR